MVSIRCCQITFIFEVGVNLYCLRQYHSWIIDAHFSEGFMSSVLLFFDLACKLPPKIFFQNEFTPPSESSPGCLSPICQFRYKFLNPRPYHLTSILIVLQTVCEAASLRFPQMALLHYLFFPLTISYFQNWFSVNVSPSHLISEIAASAKLSMQSHL